MRISVNVIIKKTPEAVWTAITDFKNCSNYISGILSIKILNRPEQTLLGLKWQETRSMFGKEATETMWITDFKENEFYETRAESHGSIYISKFSIEPVENDTKLTMSFLSQPQTFFVKLLSSCLRFLMTGSMKKVMLKDLLDIKHHLESK